MANGAGLVVLDGVKDFCNFGMAVKRRKVGHADNACRRCWDVKGPYTRLPFVVVFTFPKQTPTRPPLPPRPTSRIWCVRTAASASQNPPPPPADLLYCFNRCDQHHQSDDCTIRLPRVRQLVRQRAGGRVETDGDGVLRPRRVRRPFTWRIAFVVFYPLPLDETGDRGRARVCLMDL